MSKEAMRAAVEALEHICRRLQMDIDDGGRPDQWSMEDLVRKAQPALSLLRAELEAGGEAAQLAALQDVADALCKQFSAAGIGAVIGSPNPAEDLHARAVLALGGKVEREHIESIACWCGPTVEHEDEDVRVIVHRRTQ